VIVPRAGGCGARTPLEDRVRVLAYDAELELPQRSGREIGLGICPIALPDLDYSTLDIPSKTRSIDVSTNDRGPVPRSTAGHELCAVLVARVYTVCLA
jgi:hypothetical protein